MIKKLIKFIVLILLLSISAFAVNAVVSISPTNPDVNDVLNCYYNGELCSTGAECSAHWYVNSNEVLVNTPILSYNTNAGDFVECLVYRSGTYRGLASVYISGINTPPVFLQDIPNVVMDEDTIYDINLDSYVFDAEGDILTWSVSGNTYINVNIVNGVATLTPGLNWNGQETLIFTADDGNGGVVSDEVIVDVLPVNDVIVLNDIDDIVMDEDTQYVLDLTLNIIDVDGDLQDIIVVGNSNINVNIDFANMLVTLTPSLDWSSSETLTVIVYDFLTSDTDDFLVTVNPVNDVPVIEGFIPVSDVTLNEGESQLFSVVATDPEGDSLSYTWEIDGSVVGTGNSYMYDALDGDSNHVLDVIVSDGTDSITQSWVVSELNVDPIADAHDHYVCTLNDDILLRGSAIDPGQEVFTFEWDTDADGNYDDGSTQEIQITCDNSFTLEPDNNLIRLRVSDGDGGISEVNTVLIVRTEATNNRPYFDPVLEDQITVVDDTFNYDIDAYDADPLDVLTYSDDASEFDIDSDGLISFIPTSPGVIPVTITVCDDSGLGNACYSESFNVDVSGTGVNEDPIVGILIPNDEASYNYGNNVFFGGFGFDPEDGSLTGSYLQWTSDLDLDIGEGVSFSTNSLSVGDHVITLTGIDSVGATDSDSILLTITSVALPQCSDGIDNDGDSLIDYPDDPGCDDALDDDETDVVVLPQCGDGIDNDGDGLIDLEDPGCVDLLDDDETDPSVLPQCADLIDNDGDGLIDLADPGCSSAGDDDESYSGTPDVGFSGLDYYNREHKFEIKEFKVISNVEAGKDVRLLVEVENKGDFDEDVNLKLKSNRLLLVKEYGEYLVEEDDSSLMTLLISLPKEADGVYILELEVYNDDYEVSKLLELDVNERESFTSLLTGGVAGYNIEIEKEWGNWIWVLLILVVLVLIGLGLWKLYGGKDEL